MSMTSFYGGRQGASINIVRTFDCIKELTEPKYKYAYYAVDGNDVSQRLIWDNTISNFIERTPDNYNDYVWRVVKLNGHAEECNDGNDHNVPTELQESMVTYFKRGGDTTGLDGVNYGEYVLIDTSDKNDPDNGKIFRRGLDFTNDLGGAEYRGQIVGPRGGNAELSMGDFVEMTDPSYPYSVSTSDSAINIVPGKYQEEESGVLVNKFHDQITSAWCYVSDELGEISKYLISFQMPHTSFDFTAESISPYNLPADLITRDIASIGNHNFYEKWDLKVPHGIKGNSARNFKIYYTKIPVGSNLYGSAEDARDEVNVITQASEELNIDYKNVQYLEWLNDYSCVKVEEQNYYANKKDAYKTEIWYKEVSYDTSAEGEEAWQGAGDFNNIEKVELSNEGIFTIDYSNEGSQQIRDDITWIKKVEFDTSDGKLKVKFNNDKLSVEYGSDWDPIYHGYVVPLNSIEDIYIDNNQYLTIKYYGQTAETVGAPLNYVMHTIVSDEKYETDPSVTHVDSNHLLVYYAAPDFRGTITYPTLEDPTVIKYGWKDIGFVKGDTKSIGVIGSFPSESDLYDPNTGDAIPPEVLANDPGKKGWLVTIPNLDPVSEVKEFFYGYDYVKNPNIWYKIGGAGSGGYGTPIVISETDPTTALEEQGIWMVEETIYNVRVN